MLSIKNPDYTRANEVMDGHEKRTFEMIDEGYSRSTPTSRAATRRRGTRLRSTVVFVDALADVQSERVAQRIIRLVSYLEDMLEMGSAGLPESVKRRYGVRARKLVATPFDILYTYDAEVDEVHVDGLVHQRAVV